MIVSFLFRLLQKNVQGAGGLHEDFLEIDFLVVSDKEE